MSQCCLIPLLTRRFSAKTELGVLLHPSPVAGIRVNAVSVVKKKQQNTYRYLKILNANTVEATDSHQKCTRNYFFLKKRGPGDII